MAPRHSTSHREGAFAHYRDPVYYDRIYRRRRHDVDYYVTQATTRRASVLELGCGSGRVSIALARQGVRVVGVDALEEMIRHAEAKRARLPHAARDRLRFVRADMRRLRLSQRFSLVIAPFNVFMHLYDRRDVEQALDVVRRHLRPRGRLIFDVRMPDPRELLRDPHRLYRCPDLRDPATGRRYHYMESFDYDAQAQVQRVSMVFENIEDERDIQVRPLTQRLFYPAELDALLHYNGFAVESHTGDFEGEPPGCHHESQVVVARAVRRRPR